MNRISFSVKNFKAIADADIKIDGITVLSGVNSSGKSTLSKLLYYIVKLALEFEETQIKRLSERWERILLSLSRLADDLQIEDNQDIVSLWRDKSQIAIPSILHETFFSLLKVVEKSFIEREKTKAFTDKEITRIAGVLAFPLHIQLKKNKQYRTISELFDDIRKQISDYETQTADIIRQRPLFFFENELAFHFKEKSVPVSFREDDIPILDRKNGRLNNIYSVEHVFYSDTPMAISMYKSGRRYPWGPDTSHWDFLRDIVLNSPTIALDEQQQQVNDHIASIISGNVSLDEAEFDRHFSYTRSTDGLTIDLADSATGIKSFALLQLLLTEGLLNNKTLLILDEPEAHLHPQWIVEYARILVLLNKHLGVRSMIASHNPDMVSALRYIAEKEKMLERLHFYLAEKDIHTEQYHYKNLKTDIEPIFGSFNIALDRINQYGV